jgi:hypothetical protein
MDVNVAATETEMGYRKIRSTVMEFLKALSTSMVPPKGCAHALTYATAESDLGPVDQLVLQVWTDKGARLMYLEEGDLESKTARELAGEIHDLVRKEEIHELRNKPA